MRVNKVLRAILGFTREVVITGVELIDGTRPRLRVQVRPRRRRRGRCGRCGELGSWFDRGDGMRSWRHVDAGFATVELVGLARRVRCGSCGPTVAAVPWARHDTAFTRAFEDLVVHDAIVGNKQAAADRYGVSWRAVNNMCRRVAEEALDRIDLLDGLVAIAIDEAAIRWSPRSRPGRPGSCGPASRTGRASSGRRRRASHRAPVEPPAAAGRRCPVVPLSTGRLGRSAG